MTSTNDEVFDRYDPDVKSKNNVNKFYKVTKNERPSSSSLEDNTAGNAPLKELALLFLLKYFPNWKNYSIPQSYILPPDFQFAHADRSDASIESAQTDSDGKGSSTFNRLMIDRSSDHAEFKVFDAIIQLIQENTKAPFVAFHALSTNRMRTQLPAIFPDLDSSDLSETFEKRIQEYDFLLIGPEIGVVVIEVKGSSFTQKKHFTPKNKYLPDLIIHGIRQLESTDGFLEFLQHCAGMGKEKLEIPVKKILFTPNLSKHRYDQWIAEFNDDQWRSRLEETIGDVIHWFTEDMEVNHPELQSTSSLYTRQREAGSQSLYTTLRRLIKSCEPMSRDIYENFVPIIATMASVASAPAAISKSQMFTLDRSKFSEADIIKSRGAPAEVLKAKSIQKYGVLQKPETLKLVTFLTSDQSKVFYGPPKQLIIGAAGTGKSLILQEKALQLLEQGHSVVVLAQNGVMEKYKSLFDAHDYSRYAVKAWPDEATTFTSNDDDQLRQSYVDFGFSRASDFGRPLFPETTLFFSKDIRVVTQVSSLRAYFSVLSSSDHILIDDVMVHDGEDVSKKTLDLLIIFLLLMAQDKALNRLPERTIWVSMDYYTVYYALDHYDLGGFPIVDALGLRKFIEKPDILRQELPQTISSQSLFCSSINDQEYCTVILLEQVVRCTESIFRHIFNQQPHFHGSSEIRLSLDHKVHGLPVTVIRRLCPLEMENSERQIWDSAVILVWDSVKKQLQYLNSQEICWKDMAIITDGYHHHFGPMMRTFLEDQCREMDMPISVFEWSDVSSLEWPVIIFAYLDRSRPQNRSFYGRYRACTRAVSKLIEISVCLEDL